MNKKKKNILSRIGAVIVAVLCMVTPMSAFAAEGETTSTIDNTKTGSITVYKYNLTDAESKGVNVKQWEATGEANSDVQTTMAPYAIKGVEFTYVKVGDIDTASVNGTVDVVYEIPANLQTILGLSGKSKYTSTEINTALSDKLSQNNTGVKADLTSYVKNGGKTITTDAKGTATASNLELGLYLMVETKFPNNISGIVNPFFVSVPMTKANGSGWFYDVTVYPKNQTTEKPTLDKLVRQDGNTDNTYKKTANGSIGDKMDYIFVSHLPVIGTDAAAYLDTYKFTDKASAGLKYNEQDVNVYFYANENDAKANDTNKAEKTWTKNTDFKVSYTTNDDGTTTMTVVPTEVGYTDINANRSGKFMVVAYSATITENAILGDKGNENDVTLEWKRASSDEIGTIPSNAKVFSFGLNLTKIFKGTKDADATKVQFILKNATDGKYITATGSNGAYKVSGKEADEKSATVFELSTDKKLKIDGIEADTYELTEIATSDGYSLLKEPITIMITKDGDVTASATVNGENASMSTDTASSSANARVELNVVNTATFTLPMTGGAGTILFTLCGCLLALVGISIITGKKKTR